MIKFKCSSSTYQLMWDKMLDSLRKNCKYVYGCKEPVLIEGERYPGIWLECAPLEGLVYAPISLDIAKRNHKMFYRMQRESGQFPAYIWAETCGFSQIQQVVPLIETAYELAMLCSDEKFLIDSFNAWGKWDQWLSKHRDSRNRNLCEAFCEYDTGHDNSSRFHDIPKTCYQNEAANCPPDIAGLPYLAPDLSATLYGGRVTMAKIAAQTGDRLAHDYWLEVAEKSRSAIMKHCFDPDQVFFYDRDCNGKLIEVSSDAGIRVLMEHIPEQQLFDRIYEKWIVNPSAFWTRYPFPSVAVCDEHFIYPPGTNCWGGASQALIALRAPRWLEHYGKFSALNYLMRQWIKAIVNAGDFKQQLDPFTGEFTTGGTAYSPSMCCMLDFSTRLAGVMETSDGLVWGTSGIPEAGDSYFEAELISGGSAAVEITNGTAILKLRGKELCRINGQCRLFCNRQGNIRRLSACAAGRLRVSMPDGSCKQWDTETDQSIVP